MECMSYARTSLATSKEFHVAACVTNLLVAECITATEAVTLANV